MLIYRIYNKYHLGDNIFNFIMFYHIKEYIEQKKIIQDTINLITATDYRNSIFENHKLYSLEIISPIISIRLII